MISAMSSIAISQLLVRHYRMLYINILQIFFFFWVGENNIVHEFEEKKVSDGRYQ